MEGTELRLSLRFIISRSTKAYGGVEIWRHHSRLQHWMKVIQVYVAGFMWLAMAFIGGLL
jgi:hypothetical protein